MMTKISILLCSRISGNINHNLSGMLQSFVDKTCYPKEIEFLIKFDKCDPLLEEAVEIVNRYKSHFSNIKYIITDRKRGYEDLHLGYKDLLKIVNKNSSLYWILSDDIKITLADWDRKVSKLLESKQSSDYFVIHPTHLTNLDDGGSHDLHSIINILETYPIFSKSWVDLVGFGEFVFTDAWCSLLEFFLYKKHKIDNRLFLDEKVLERSLCQHDMSDSERHNSVRKETHNELLSPNTIAKIINLTKKLTSGPIISIFISSVSQEAMEGFFSNLEETSDNPSNFEVLINIDLNREDLRKFLDKQNEVRKFIIKYIETDNNYFSLNLAYNHLVKLTSKSSEIYSVLSDYFIFKTKGWDKIIITEYERKSYIFKDKIFYLRISKHKNYINKDLISCWDFCENWGFYSKEWVVTLGGWGEFWCPDATQEIIYFYLKKNLNKNSNFNIDRSFPIKEIGFEKAKTHKTHSYATNSDYKKKFLGELFFVKRMLSYKSLKYFNRQSILLLNKIDKTGKMKTVKISWRFFLIQNIKQIIRFPKLYHYIILFKVIRNPSKIRGFIMFIKKILLRNSKKSSIIKYGILLKDRDLLNCFDKRIFPCDKNKYSCNKSFIFLQ